MAILDFLTGGKAKRARAARLLEALRLPFERLRNDVIHDPGVAQIGEDFEGIWARFVDCRILYPENLMDMPREERDALDRLVVSQMAAARPLFVEIRAAMEVVQREWRHGGLVAAAAGGCLRALDAFDEMAEPETEQSRLFRILMFLEVDVACGDVAGELEHIAYGPSLFW